MALSPPPPVASWKCPDWHADWDAPAQFDHLRRLAGPLAAAGLLGRTEFHTPEEGLMLLEVSVGDGRKTEIHTCESVGRPGERVYGVFRNVDTPDEGEVYADTPEAAVALAVAATAD